MDSVCKKWTGSIQIGLTAALPGNDNAPSIAIPSSLSQLCPSATWYVKRSEVWHDGKKICDNYCPSLDRSDVGDVIGIKRSSAGCMHLYVNGRDMGVATTDIPQVTLTSITGSRSYICRSLIHQNYTRN